MHKLERGQKLLYVGNVYGSNRTQRTEVTVASVGRTWAQIEGPFCGRIDMETLVVDGRGFGSPGTCYLSREHYQQQEGPKLAWNSLRAAMGNAMPNGVSYENVVVLRPGLFEDRHPALFEMKRNGLSRAAIEVHMMKQGAGRSSMWRR